MNLSVVPVHPQIKKIIQNLDLDLGLELDRYENSHYQESISAIDPIVEEFISSPEKKLNHQELSSSLVYNPNDIDSEEAIPVASRLINSSSSILDIILTPWGIIGILLFFGANIFIFFSLDEESLIDNNQVSNITENNLNFPNTQKTENNNNNINLDNIKKNQDIAPQTISSLPEINNSISKNSSSQNSSIYPDLKSALFAEINKTQQPSSLSNDQKNTLPTSINSSNSKIEKKYYLLSNYQNMDNFNRIKKIVPNALIMNLNQEMKIQLGLFNTEIEAQNQGDKLKNQGIEVYIQPINN
ncbi:hypothetical protein GM3708_2898 [Geminocystis sp. NIES-3708]|uniref:hypothetical protein n=1 Tax=Geminocystis sp. NIES-3708 TaxID=1615909 RepID=UPI0005FC9A19|nr:hypothetical protein [Geminocystis sp. NIES-3708]BAQ62492.1 hypothetical protein GM3708_2898 [Geminocystis sp. NIES-3708]